MNPKLKSISSALVFIECHLGEEITVGEIAESAGYSLYHFIRTFNQIVGHSPYDFMMRRRLSEASHELLASDRRILDIALDYCFHSHETFSRAFKRMFDIQPSQWPSKKAEFEEILLPPLSQEYLEHINQHEFRPPQIISSGSGSLVRFFHPGSDQSLHLTLSYIHHTWLPQSGIRLAYKPAPGHFLLREELNGLAVDVPVV